MRFGPNGGVRLARFDGCEALLPTWWHIDGEAYHQIHDFDAPQWRLVHSSGAARAGNAADPGA